VQELSTLWLNGMAGTGKTAIAGTFARNLREQGVLGATFFVDRQQEERRSLTRIVQTLAYDLAKHNHEQLRAVWTVLRDDPTFERLSYQEQVRLLIKGPLDVVRPETLVILIDGLDECGASHGASLLATLVSMLARHPVKLFVTSRDETDIASMLRGISHTSVKLQDVEVSGDVQLYWERNLDDLCRNKGLTDWRSMVSLEALVENTGHLFIYATTILEIIMDTRISPIKKLLELLEISHSGNDTVLVFDESVDPSPLDKLYFHIMAEAVRDKRGNTRTEYAVRLHDILEIVIFAREPVSPQALSGLLGMDKHELDAYLSHLRSVLVVPDATGADGIIRPLHQSFPDFVRQKGHVVHAKLKMDVALAHKNIVEHCFSHLNKLLHYDMCDIQDASLFNHEVLDLKTRVNRLSVALWYSCKHWPAHLLEHLRGAGSKAQTPLGLPAFCRQHLLHWIEVLSLTKDMSAVQRVMQELIAVIHVCFSHS
jgi:hypothetical protein